MFEAMHGIRFGFILCGIIWAGTVGIVAGSYACSVVHRLPRGRLILDKKPYCGHCGHDLDPVWDLIPIFSALWLHHRCRWCKQPFPVSHTWTEVLMGILFLLTYFKYNFGEQFFLINLIGIFLTILAAIHANEGVIMGKILLCVAAFGALYRTLQDASIYGFFEGGFFGLILGAIIWRKQVKPSGHVFTLPMEAQALTVGGICVGAQGLPLFAVLFALFYFVLKLLLRARLRITVPFGLAVIIPVLYPKLETLAFWLHR